MRPKVSESEKRGTIIGIKVDKLTKAKIDYIAKADGDTTSTYLFNLITAHIDQYTRISKIKWDEELSEKGEK
ncbi:MAG: hypothetical protein IJ977_09025 [Fibrobacter sp.]|nr:hypothetical protein [Fibrobacter sp.]